MDGDGDILRPQHLLFLDHLLLLFGVDIGIMEIGLGKARLDQADLDVATAQFLAQRLGERRDSRLHPGINCRTRAQYVRRHRPDQHDVAAISHRLDRLVRAHQIGGEIGRDRIAQVARAHLAQAAGRDRRIDHRDVEAAQPRDRIGEIAFDIVLIRQVDRAALGRADLPDHVQRIVEMLFVTAADIDGRALARQQHGDRAADAGGAAGDDRALALQAQLLGVGVGNGARPVDRAVGGVGHDRSPVERERRVTP